MMLSKRSGFSGELWAAGESIYRNILLHPFLEGLANGTLDVQAFRFYVVEDAYYLREFARALSILAAKAPREEWIVHFDRDAIETLEAERALHESFFKDFGLSEEEVRSRPPAPTNLSYSSYLLATAHASPFAEALSAVLPCYWIYAEVGKVLSRKGSPHPLYQRWIASYASEAYEAVVDAVLDIMDEAAKEEGPGSRARMIRHFITASRYEWMFWEMGYRQEAWPV